MTDTIMSYSNEISVKDIQKKGINVLDNSIVTNVFLKDYKKAYNYKKAEKLSLAVHVVLAHVEDKKGVTDILSERSLTLVREILHSQTIQTPSKTILEIISLIQVGETTGVLATKNAELLAREYHFLLSNICEQKPQSIDLDTEVEVEETPAPKKVFIRTAPSTTQSQDKGHKGHPADRKGHVLEIIKNNGNVGIKDIAKEVTDCSEKTIQRILNTLIEEGRVKKEGERRWSTYHYVS
ncbi:MAG: hypothetical protein ACJKSS_01155 [Patescibacteria group bacterium UBA2103]